MGASAGGGRSLKEAAKISAKNPPVLVTLILLATLPLFLSFEGWHRVVAVMNARPRFWIPYLVSLLIVALIIMVPLTYNWLADRVEYLAVGLLILLFAVLGFGILNFSSDWGALKGDDAAAGEAVRPLVLYGILGIQADPVCVTWIGDDSEAPRTNRPFIYLGQAQGLAVLYDYYRPLKQRRTVRVPTSKVALTHVDASRNPIVNDGGVPNSSEPPLDCIASKLTPPPTTTTTTTIDVPTTTSTLPPTAVACWIRSLMS